MNKNTKRRQQKIRLQRREEVSSKTGPVSVSTEKNIQMVVRHNVDAFGNKDSHTSFELLNIAKPAYRRFRA